jgi:hypothetical protein
MRCAIVSRAGQTLARGRLVLHRIDDENLRLDLITDRGTQLEGGIVATDGDMTEASFVLSQQFFAVWGMTDLTLSVTLR